MVCIIHILLVCIWYLYMIAHTTIYKCIYKQDFVGYIVCIYNISYLYTYIYV